MRVNEYSTNYSADAQTRWLRYLGPQRFAATFLNNDPQALVQYLERINTTFGVSVDRRASVGPQVRVLDLADSDNAKRRLFTGDKERFGFPEVTAEFVGDLNETIGYLNSTNNGPLANRAVALRDTMVEGLKALEDKQGYFTTGHRT